MNPDHSSPASSLPDAPRWVEANGILAAGCGRVLVDGTGCVIRNEQPGSRLIVAVTPPTPALLDRALIDRPDAEVLCMPEHEPALDRLLPHWQRERAYLYSLDREHKLAPRDGNVRSLRPDDSLDHLSDELRSELAWDRSTHTMVCTFVGDRPASFAYAHWKTPKWYDISIDTVPEYRRQGLGRLAVSELIRRQNSEGRAPVWGAMASNLASQRMAERTGFTKIDEIVVFSCAPRR